LDNALAAAVADAPLLRRIGRATEAIGTTIRAVGLNAHIGQTCEIRDRATNTVIQAEVIGLRGDTTLLMPLGPLAGLSIQCEVVPGPHRAEARVGDGLLGRVIDAQGEPLDGLGPIAGELKPQPLYADAPSPMARPVIRTVFSTGVRAIDGLLPVGRGQRMGIFSLPGVGKSALMGMLARHCAADVNVIALIGERGREVRDFIEGAVGPSGLARSVVVATTSDRPAMERVRAANLATAVAERFRADGRHVLLLMDSVTRFARALREVGLAAGESPARRGFPSSVFAELPRLFERAGAVGAGSITAFYSVLMEDEDGDPIAEEVRSILDGHIQLSRRLAEAGRYPAIDVSASVSRLTGRLAEPLQAVAALKIGAWLAKHQDIALLLQTGDYKPGSDADADQALARMPAIEAYLRQGQDEGVTFAEAIAQLRDVAA